MAGAREVGLPGIAGFAKGWSMMSTPPPAA
jgi:hypothetical protein